MQIQHNLAALNTYNQLTGTMFQQEKSIEKLSTGLRINRAGDDAAGLAISELMRAQIRGLNQASRNAQDGISMIQTAEAALQTTHTILQRVRELAVQASNDTLTVSDRGQLQKEVDQLKQEIDRIAYTTEFNTKKLLDGSITGAKRAAGSHAVSAELNVLQTASVAATLTAGRALGERDAQQTQLGAGAAVEGFRSLDEKIQIATGVNDRFVFTVNGVTHESGQIAASTNGGYTRAEFVQAVQAAIDNTLSASGQGFERQQIVVELTADQRIRFSSKEAGTHTNIQISDSSDANASALAAFGLTGVRQSLESTIDISDGLSVVGSGGTFNVVVGAAAADIVLASGTWGKQSVIEQLQTQLDAAFGKNRVAVSDRDGDGKLNFDVLIATRSFSVGSGSGTTAGSGLENMFGYTAGQVYDAGVDNSGTAIFTDGRDSYLGYEAGFRVAEGVNDQFRVAIHRGEYRTISLTEGIYSTGEKLVQELNLQLGADQHLSNAVAARLTDEGRVELYALQGGEDSYIDLQRPSDTHRSALGLLGFDSTAGTIEGTVDLRSGVTFSGDIADLRFQVTLGGKTALIDLSKEANIVTSGGLTPNGGATSKDAVMLALQSELDQAFGEGSIHVSYVRAGSEDRLRLNPLADASRFTVSSYPGYGGMTYLFDAALTSGALLSAGAASEPNNIYVGGTASQNRELNSATRLTDLADHNGTQLGLQVGNVVTFTGSQNGAGFTASILVEEDSTVGDLLGMMRSVPAFHGAVVGMDLMKGTIEVLGKEGASNDLSNLRLSARASATDHTPVGGFNRPLGSFAVLQQAQDASADRSLTLQVGANQGINDHLGIERMDAAALKLSYVDVSTQEAASYTLSVLDAASDFVSNERAKLGAIQARLENTSYNLSVFSENLIASESRIRDVDIAQETMQFTKAQILQQAGQAMLSQANQQSSSVLVLLR